KSLSMLVDVNPCKIKLKKDLENLDGLILPGGESTTIGKLLKIYNMFDTLKEKIEDGLPVWGTCAGMILLANDIVDENIVYLGVLNASVKRNAYGSQLDSFYSKAAIKQISKNEIPLVFIRAPWINKISDDVEILLKIDDKIVAVKEHNILATSFHPELTDSLEFHKYFVEICKNKS
ncbi:MAG: pyridoxal 5'-phosphate synthase glutaminase subunit PdxT, partial [Clostridiales bacterium]